MARSSGYWDSQEHLGGEVMTALRTEREQERVVLFPVRLDDAVFQVGSDWPAFVRETRNIGDFRRWHSHVAYQQPFDRLLRDLQRSDEQNGGRP